MVGTSESDDDGSRTPPISSDGPATHVECIEDGCNSEVPVATWDNGLLSGRVAPQCDECSQDVPEVTVWNIERIEETNPTKSTNIPDISQIPEDTRWTVADENPSSLEEFQEKYGNLGSDMYDPDDNKFIILIRDPENTEALESAREQIRELR